MKTAPTYNLYADIFDYPSDNLPSAVAECGRRLAHRLPEAAEHLACLEREAKACDTRAMMEKYAAIFDFSPARTMDLGYQLFGETYKRGIFLVKMKEALEKYQIPAGNELPDHLPSVLRMLSVLKAEDEPRDLVEEVILPSVEKILRTFDGEGDVYRHALLALKTTLMADFDIDHVEIPRTAETLIENGGKKLPMFPGFSPPVERVLS
ncbi:MAG: nitrate reductase molybdenum cofactor assembly chaperone [Polyangiaceae bacterium]|nr:nitrate reductase molybdenum cofactor assembly chaperone [Polyangiaceae bacterium]